MENNLVKQIHSFGQSIWLDFIDRKLMQSGELKSLIEVDGIRGITSNPAIFEKAISSSSDYDAQIHELAKDHSNNEDIFFNLAIKDIQEATDFFKPVYEEKEVGSDGYVSLEVSPFLARETEKTIAQALDLWKKVDRKNVMIKIPGTAEGLKAITETIAEGLNINVTLLFGLKRYEEVAEAYITGLEKRHAEGKSIEHISSVASFFLSRIDVMIDPLLEEKGHSELRGEVAIASAKMAYQIYKRVFSSNRFKRLEEYGAKPQRVLWASTSSKDPKFSDTKYVEALIGPHTVNTIPMETLVAFRDHGKPANRLEMDIHTSESILAKLKELNINLDEITQKLEDEGIEKFNKPFEKLLNAIETTKNKIG